MKTLLIAGVLAGLACAPGAQAGNGNQGNRHRIPLPPSSDQQAAAASHRTSTTVAPSTVGGTGTPSDRQKLHADRQQLHRDAGSGKTASKAVDKQTVAADSARLGTDTGHVVGRKHGGNTKAGEQ